MFQFVWKKTAKSGAEGPRPLRGELLELRCLLSAAPNMAALQAALPPNTPPPTEVRSAARNADSPDAALLSDDEGLPPSGVVAPSPTGSATRQEPAVAPMDLPSATDGPANNAPESMPSAASPTDGADAANLARERAAQPSNRPLSATPSHPASRIDPPAEVRASATALEAELLSSSADGEMAKESAGRPGIPAQSDYGAESSATTGAKSEPRVVGRAQVEWATAAIYRSLGAPARIAEQAGASLRLGGGGTADNSTAATGVGTVGSTTAAQADTNGVRDQVFAALADDHHNSASQSDATARFDLLGSDPADTGSQYRATAPAAFTSWGLRNPSPIGGLLGDSDRPVVGKGSGTPANLLFAEAPGAALATGAIGAVAVAGMPERAAIKSGRKSAVEETATARDAGSQTVHRYAIHPTYRLPLDPSTQPMALPPGQQLQIERLQTQLTELQEQLARQARLAMVGQAAASIAHDLRNPLAVVRNAAWLLKQDLPPEAADSQQYLEAIDSEVDHANRIIGNLMEAVRAKEPAKQAVDLGTVVAEVFDRLQNRGPSVLRFDAQPDPFTVDADPVQLRQVWGNLLGNAVEAMRGEGEILVQARQQGRFDEVLVRDTGPGIPPEIRATLFEPLVSTRAKGTGLGLAICRQIIERHGGTIELLPPDSPGAAFLIRLPHTAGPNVAPAP